MTEYSESVGKTFNLYGIKEPINSLSSLFMSIYTLYNINYDNISNINNIIKIIIVVNLLSSVIYHGTYNNTAELLDGFTMILPFIYIFIYYKYYLFTIISIILYSLFDCTIAFTFSFITFFIIKYKSIKDNTQFVDGFILCLFASIFRFSDIIFNKYWYLYGHAFWHVFMALGLIKIINSLDW